MAKLNSIKRFKQEASSLRKSAVLLMSMGLLAFAAIPVQAHGPGPHASGTAVGKADFTHPVVTRPCTEFTSLTFAVNQAGFYSATQSGTTATYEGLSTLTATLPSNTSYYEGPGGTYTNSTCSGSPTAITVSVSVAGSGPQASVACGPVDGTYIRDGLTATVVAAHDCVVTDLVTTRTESMTQTTSGLMQPCIVDAPPDSCFFEGTYTAP